MVYNMDVNLYQNCNELHVLFTAHRMGSADNDQPDFINSKYQLSIKGRYVCEN